MERTAAVATVRSLWHHGRWHRAARKTRKRAPFG